MPSIRPFFTYALVIALTAGAMLTPSPAQDAAETPPDFFPKSAADPEKADAAAVNKAVGADLFADDNIWDDSAADVANRLHWKKESETNTISSYRLYAKPDEKLFGARPYSCALYGRNGKVETISIVFANSGDFEPFRDKSDSREEKGSSRASSSNNARGDREVEKQFSKLLDEDKKAIGTALVEVLGAPKSGTFGGSIATREFIDRWDWKDTSFVLSVRKRGYVCLRIVPKSIADDSKGERIGDQELAAMLLKNVEKRPNGDVFIGQIPMVDQGPKGYCLPATWERYLRYIGVSTDMYLLAMTAGTNDGGGTTASGALAAVQDLVYHAGRRIDSVPTPVSVRNVSKWIDQGLPIMFECRVNEQFDHLLFKRVKERAAAPDAATWKKVADDYRAKAKDADPGNKNHHMRMIVGYNADTDEVAITDSWGPHAAERWITVDEANAMSDNNMTVVRF